MAKRNFRSHETKYGFIFEEKTVLMVWFNAVNDEEPSQCKYLGIYEVTEILKDISPSDYPIGYAAMHNFYECIHQLRLELVGRAKFDNVLYIQYTNGENHTQINMNRPITDVDMLRMLNLALLENGHFQLQPMWSEDEERAYEARGYGSIFSTKVLKTKPGATDGGEVKE